MATFITSRYRLPFLIGSLAAAQHDAAGTSYVVRTTTNILYLIFIDVSSDVVFRKSDDNGRSWSSPPTAVFTGTAVGLSVWYDRWSNISAGLIHCAYTESATDDTLYRTINTESADALSTQTTIFAGASTLAGGHLSICRARGGNVYCKTVIDAGTEGGFFRLPNANVPNGAWDAARTVDEAIATQDQMILVPGWGADNQDMMAFFWDASANEVSRKLYDDSANTWGETSIATSMTDALATDIAGFPHFAAAVDITNSRNLLVAWSAVDTANADLRCWHVTESAITEVTNVVLNSADDQSLCAIGIDTDTEDWYVFYSGNATGAESVGTTTGTRLYYKVSTDDGATWSAQLQLSDQEYWHLWLACIPRFTKPFGVAAVAAALQTTGFDLVYMVDSVQPRAISQIGI